MNTNLVRFKDLIKYYPFIEKETSLRNLIVKNKNNIKSTMVKIGGKLFFDLDKFEKWIDEQRLGR